MSEPAKPARPGPLRNNVWPWLAAAGVLVILVVVLHARGRPWWCACGDPHPLSGDAQSSHNSQHLFDPYSLAHVLHGVLFCGLLAWAFPRWPAGWRLAGAVALEAGWELFENSEMIIQRFRTATLALGYQGDTIVNSLGDTVSAAAGFVLARRLGLRGSVLLYFAIEILLLVWIRDNLFLSGVMLVFPIEVLKQWQTGGE